MRRPPQLRSGGEEHRHASWLELFFDLVFVAVVFQIGEGLAEHHDADGFLRFTGLLTIVAWSWMCFTYFGNRFDTDDVPQRILMSLAMLAVAGLGVAVGDDTNTWSERFAIAQVGVHVVLLCLYLRARMHVPAARASIDRYLVGFGLGALVWLASAFVDTPGRYVLWGLALAIEVATPLLSWGVLARLPVDREHLRERFGLFTIIVLGEALLAVVIGTQEARWGGPAIATTIAGFLGVLALWWVYFDEQSAATLRGGRWGFVVAYGHLPLWLGATAYGIGVKLAIEHADDLAEEPGLRWALAGGAAVLLAAIAAFHLASAQREPGVLTVARLALHRSAPGGGGVRRGVAAADVHDPRGPRHRSGAADRGDQCARGRRDASGHSPRRRFSRPNSRSPGPGHQTRRRAQPGGVDSDSANSPSSSVNTCSSVRPAAARSAARRSRVNFALISVRSSSRGANSTSRPSAAMWTCIRRLARRRISIHSRSRSKNATCSNASTSKSAPSSRLRTCRTLRLNCAVMPAESS